MDEEEVTGEMDEERNRGGGGEEAAGTKVEAEAVELEQKLGVYEKQGLLLDDDDDGCYEGIAEDAVAELMRWLEAEISDDAPAPEEEQGFVTINDNVESCGPSFSCAASTVMASVDMRLGAPPPPPVPWPFPEAATVEQETFDEACLTELLACGLALQGGV